MGNKVKFTLTDTPPNLASINAVVTNKEQDTLLWSGVHATTGGAVELDIGTAGTDGQNVWVYGNNADAGGEGSANAFGGYSVIEAGELLKTYDTVVGVGDSITAGEYDLSGGQYDNPYRGINFRTGAQYGTTLFQMIENVTDFTSQAEGRTLFIVRAGINDCNTYLSAGGVGDGDAGSVLAWGDLSVSDQELTISRYRQLISLLKDAGDVALGTITYCDAKGQLLPLPDKGRDLHSGSWNDNTTVPLCQELTPEWFNSETGRPILDYYQVTYDDPTSLDDDNLHFYNDRTFVVPEGLGYTDGPGSYTIREETLKKLGENTSMPSTPFDSERYSNRILVNIGRGNGLIGRPSFQRWANSCSVSSAQEVYPNLNSYNGTTSVSLRADFDGNGSVRDNLFTTDQVWSEGAADTNCCSSGLYTGTKTLTHEFTGVTKGTVSMVGVFSSSGNGGTYDPTIRTVFEVEDDSGIKTVEVPSSIDGANVTLADCTGYVDFDCSAGGILKVTPKQAAGSQYATISSICIDLE